MKSIVSATSEGGGGGHTWTGSQSTTKPQSPQKAFSELCNREESNFTRMETRWDSNQNPDGVQQRKLQRHKQIWKLFYRDVLI